MISARCSCVQDGLRAWCCCGRAHHAPSLPLKDVHRGITCPAQEGRLSRNGLRTHRLESPLEQARHASNARVVPFPSDVTPRGLPPCHAHRAMQAYTEPR
jgi:hypothetical protein